MHSAQHSTSNNESKRVTYMSECVAREEKNKKTKINESNARMSKRKEEGV